MLRTLANLADTGPLRPILAFASSQLAGTELSFEYDQGFWLYRTEGYALPYSRKFNFYKEDVHRLPNLMRHYLNEAADCWFYLYKPQIGETIVDVGAEIGTDTIAFAKAVGRLGKVYAVEAQPETYQMLLATCRANRLDNVVPIPRAVADKPGIVRISRDAAVEANFLCEDGDPVEADSLDNMLRDVPRIDLLKMNIEGAERLAIRGMAETIAKTRYIVIACHDFVGAQTGNDWFNTQEVVTRYLEHQGMTVITRDDDPREYARYHIHAYAKRR